jgi:hypothetical protein
VCSLLLSDKGAGSRIAGLAMAYKLLAAAQARWRCVNAPHLVARVRARATFVDGILVEREDRPTIRRVTSAWLAGSKGNLR